MPQTTYAYQTLMEEHKLTVSELPEDAQTGITSIKDIEKAINAQAKKAEKNGKKHKITAAAAAKIKSFDKWVVGEILDYVEDKNTNPAAPPVAATTIIEEIKEEPPATPNEPVPVVIVDDTKGIEVDKEFEAMLKAGKIEVSLEELKALASTSYAVIFDSYEKDGENGIETSNFSLKEQNDKFILIQK